MDKRLQMKSENGSEQQGAMIKVDGSEANNVNNGTTNNNSSPAAGRKKRSADQSIKSKHIYSKYTYMYIYLYLLSLNDYFVNKRSYLYPTNV